MPENRPPRVLISKIGLDGHDRGAKLIVRNLRDAGMEVIYTGLWQTPASTVHAAIQEDVDVIGVSLLSAAHMTIIPEVVRLVAAAGISDTPVVVGGIIPEADKPGLEQAGCAGVFNPGTSSQTIIEAIRDLTRRRRERQAQESTPGTRTSAGLARALTWVSDGRPVQASPPSADEPRAAPRPASIGITGAPGVGKSTFIGRLARKLRQRGKRVAVIAVDPTSPITGGSLLGDRLRMMQAEPDEGLFVRSLASAGMQGGIAPHVPEAVALFHAAGYDVVLLETVGAGQNDVEVRKVTPRVLLLVMPGAGDAVQFTKAGIVEIASAFVVNKADLPGADKTIKELRETLSDGPGDARPIWPVSALRGEGLEPVCDWIEST